MNRQQARLMARQKPAPLNPAEHRATAEFYQGSVPPPSMLKNFGEINQSFPERIFKMAEDAGDRQRRQLDNQKEQIELDAQNRRLEIEASERLKELEIKSRNRDLVFKNVIALLGLLVGAAVCAFLLYMSYALLMADKTGSALLTASPIIGAALVAAIKLLRK